MEKTMNFIMIAPHFPANFEPFAERLYAKGVRTLGIADEPYENLSENLKRNLTEYYRVEDMEDYDQMYRAVAYFAHKYGRIDRIESHNEYWLELDGQLRTDFNVYGVKNDFMARIKSKAKMKEIFRQAGVPVAQGRLIYDDNDVWLAVRELGFPLIIKPDNGVGASDTWKISNDDEVRQFLKTRNREVQYIMEEHIAGGIITFDGLTDKDGNIVFHNSDQYGQPALDIALNNSDMYFFVLRETPADILALGTKTVQAFGIQERFFHIEYFRLEDGSLVALEVNCRPAGGSTIDMINYANDIDLFEMYASLVTQGQVFQTPSRRYNCCYISRVTHYMYTHSHAEIYEHYGQYILQHTHVPGIFAGLMGNDGYLFRTETIEKLNEIVAFISKKNEV